MNTKSTYQLKIITDPPKNILIYHLMTLFLAFDSLTSEEVEEYFSQFGEVIKLKYLSFVSKATNFFFCYWCSEVLT